MKQESNLKPEKKYEIENIDNNRCEVILYDLDNIIEENNDEKKYIYYSFRKNAIYSEKLNDYLEKNYTILLEKAKKLYEEKLAKEIREKRNKLLEESDKEMVFDRIAFNIPKEITISSIISTMKDFFTTLSNVKNGEWAEYRQKLRDITKQEKFPYYVEFPKKPERSKNE